MCGLAQLVCYEEVSVYLQGPQQSRFKLFGRFASSY